MVPTGRIAALIAFILVPAVPAFAQVDLTGTWARSGQSDNVYAVEPVDLLGMPLNADGRAKALSYDIAALSATERQCQMYPPFYALERAVFAARSRSSKSRSRRSCSRGRSPAGAIATTP